VTLLAVGLCVMWVCDSRGQGVAPQKNEGRIRARLHSPCPEDRGDEVDDCGEAFVALLVARGNASKGFYAAEEDFDEMPPLVFFPVLGICINAT
jgi:hypothetical protein